MTIRVVIVDDHPVFRKGVRALLEANADLTVVGEAGTGGEAVTLVEAMRPDVVIMDLMLPDMTGLQATEQIRHRISNTHVIVLTSHTESDALIPALKAGAVGYILKSETRFELVNAVRAVTEGKSLVPVEFTMQLIDAIVQPEKRDPLDLLTGRELDVLRLLGRGLGNAQIAARLAIGEGTVKTHVSNLFGKLGVSDRMQAALYAIKRGLVRPDEIEL